MSEISQRKKFNFSLLCHVACLFKVEMVPLMLAVVARSTARLQWIIHTEQ